MRDLARASVILLASVATVHQSAAENMFLPADAGMKNVKTDFGAVGDGVTDDTAAINRAINQTVMTTLYFPDGVYLVRDSVGLFNSKPHSRDRFRNLQGQSREGTIIRLAPNSAGFGDPEKPKVVLSTYSGRSTGDAMHTYVRDITVEVGAGNPGASALRFMTNNTGAMERVTIRTLDPEGAGAIGLDLRQSQNGPGLISRVRVEGFDVGVQTGNTFSMVFEDLTLRDQRRVAFDNPVGRLTLRKLRTENAPLAFRNGRHGSVTLIDAEFVGGPGGDGPAIEYESPMLFLRDVETSGYGDLARSTRTGETATGLNTHGEWSPMPEYTLFSGVDAATLRLPIEETPVVPWEQDPDKWIGVGDGSSNGKLGKDITAELQAAIDRAAETGATTIYFRRGKYLISRPIRVQGSVSRVIGMQTELNFAENAALADDGDGAVFVLDGLNSDTVVFERFFLFGGWERPSVCIFDNRDAATVVVEHMSWTASRFKRDRTGGVWHLADVAGGRRGPLTLGEGEKLWARQFNPESSGNPLLVADGGKAWVLGLKTEGRVSHVVAKNRSAVEVLGGVSYQSWKNQKSDPPMFDVDNSAVSVTIGFYHYADRGFTTIVKESTNRKTRTLARKQLEGYHLPLYRSATDTPPAGQ
ncbi:MAG: glycosyl hydrolase family 28-related protein [Planctomycetota bacterium]